MLEITNNGQMTFNRGDSISTVLFINQGNALEPIRYILTENDKVYFGIMEPNAEFEQGIVKQMYTKANLNENGDVRIVLSPEDTINLLPGKYFYEIKLRTIKDGKETIQTIVPKRPVYLI